MSDGYITLCKGWINLLPIQARFRLDCREHHSYKQYISRKVKKIIRGTLFRVGGCYSGRAPCMAWAAV